MQLERYRSLKMLKVLLTPKERILMIRLSYRRIIVYVAALPHAKESET